MQYRPKTEWKPLYGTVAVVKCGLVPCCKRKAVKFTVAILHNYAQHLPDLSHSIRFLVLFCVFIHLPALLRSERTALQCGAMAANVPILCLTTAINYLGP